MIAELVGLVGQWCRPEEQELVKRGLVGMRVRLEALHYTCWRDFVMATTETDFTPGERRVFEAIVRACELEDQARNHRGPVRGIKRPAPSCDNVVVEHAGLVLPVAAGKVDDIRTCTQAAHVFTQHAQGHRLSRGLDLVTASACGTKHTPMRCVRAFAAARRNNVDIGGLLARARVDTLLESAPGSLQNYASGLRAWAVFAGEVMGDVQGGLPPSVDGLVAFSRVFNNAGTYANYLCAIRLACDVAGVDRANTNHPAVRRARVAVKK